jgi:hypothetical protein
MAISLEKASENMFRDSTPEELFGYCEEQGLKVGRNTKVENVIKKLCAALNITHDSDSAARAVIQKARPKEGIYPPMNLEGMWNFGGKRFRIKVGRPQNSNEEDKGTLVSINGERPGYPIKYGQVQVVPAPVYRRLMDLRSVTHRHEKVGNEIVTVFEEHDLYPVTTIGVEPGTEHLPESMIEWYQAKGVKWVNELKDRELRAICERLEVRTRSKKDEPLPADDMRANLFTRLYGWPDPADEEAQEAIAALENKAA